MSKIIRITESQIKKIIQKIINEQPVPLPAQTTSGGFQVGKKSVGGVPSVDSQVKDAKAKLSCVKPEEFTVKGSQRNSFVYQDGSNQYVFYDDGDAWYYQGQKRLKTGKWTCGSNGMEIRWDNDPKAVEYKPVPSKYYRKGLNIQDCAQKLDDINIGKFLFQGCQGPGVAELQSRLGFKNPTQMFGSQTKAAVVKLQTKNNVKPDGVVGRDTYSLLHIYR